MIKSTLVIWLEQFDPLLTLFGLNSLLIRHQKDLPIDAVEVVVEDGDDGLIVVREDLIVDSVLL